MKKRIFSMLLVCIMLLGMLPMGAFAAGETEIGNQSELAAMKSGGSYILTQDITLDGWTAMDFPKGTTFNGNGHTITLTGAPLFANMEGTVINLILKGSVEQPANKNTGALSQTCYGTIRNCISDVAVTYSGTSKWVYAGQIIGSYESGNNVSNCLILGTVDPGVITTNYGAAGASFSTLNISNCVAVGYDKIAQTDYGNIVSGTNCTLVAGDSYNPADYLDFFNTNRGDDLAWELVDGALALKAEAASETATQEQIDALNAAIAEAEAVDKTKLYTSGSLTSYNSALSAAKSKAAETEPTASSVVSATAALTNAVAGLTERNTAAVELPDSGVVAVTQDNFQTLMKAPTAGAYYQFAEDITLSSSFWMGSFNTMNAVLDGNGYTLTLDGVSTLWGTIGENGIVQNLGIKGSVADGYEPVGAVAKQCSGLIVNCWSEAATANSSNTVTGGFAGKLLSGGAIVNCWNTGSITTQGSSQIGAIVGSAEGNTLIQNCYWQDSALNAVGAGSGIVNASGVKTQSEFASDEFVALLNSNRGTYGKQWNMSSTGYPWFGEAQEFIPVTPDEPVEITFTSKKGTVTTFTSDGGLTISLSDLEAADAYYAGELTMEGATGWDDGGQNLIYDGNKLYLSKNTGTYTITVRYGDGESRSFAVNVVEPADAVALRLVVNNQPITDGKLTVQGSQRVVFSAEAQYREDGAWEPVPVTLLSFTTTAGDDAAYINGAVFYAKKPGTVTVTASGLTKSVTVEITSEYVPVTAIAPAPSGTYTVHERNANSDGLGSFLDLMLGHSVGNVNITPGNASYQGWTLTSGDPEVAVYVDAFLKAVLPKKAGTTTLTATSGDPNVTVTGTSEITIAYKNPVTNVTFTGENGVLTVKAGETLDLPLTFTGSTGMEDYHVTEPGMIWSFESSDGGEVLISRESLGVLVRTDKEYCVANDQYKITGKKAGTITVTGTPADTTGGATPVTFTVTVTQGAAEEPVDVDTLVSDGITGAQNYLTENAQDSYAFGFEWEIFSLIRSGASVSQGKLDAYLNSVAETYANPDASALKPTTLARVALTLGVLGEDASDFRGLNFMEKLYNSDRITDTGNESMWALIALDSRNYTVPEGAAWTRETLINEILRYQNTTGANTKGGFGLSGSEQVSVDMTAMALQALAPYYNTNEQVKTAVDLALAWLKTQMDQNCVAGGTSESTAQVLVALAALEIDPTDTSEGGFAASVARNLITALTGFQLENGGFIHAAGSSTVTSMSTIQALYSLESYRRFAAGKAGLFDLSDVSRSARSVLENRLNEANSLIEGDYTEASWTAMVEKRTAAQTVFDDTDATDDELLAADSALAEAISDLVKASAEPGGGADGSIQVYVTISNAGQVVMAQKAITVTDHNQSGGFDVDDALYAAHKAAYPGGASSGYASETGSYGLSITKLWGDISGCFGYWLNDYSCWSLADTAANGDYLTAFVYQDGTGWSDSYSKFDSHTYSAEVGKAVTLTLENAGYDAEYNTVFAPLAGADITAYDSNFTTLSADSYTVTDTGSGTYSAVFKKAGTYYLAAYCDNPIIVPAVCKVTVMSTQGGGDSSGIEVSISVKDPQGKTYLSKTSYTLAEGSTVYDLLCETGLELTTTNYSYGIYIKAIEGLGEFDQGAQSGWMYRVNGVFPEVSCDSYVLENQDNVEWLYTRDLGSDVGDTSTSNKTPVEKPAEAGEGTIAVTPVAAVDKNGSATAKVENTAITEALKQAEKDGASTIVIAPVIKGNANKVAVELPKSAAQDIVSGTDAALNVQTAVGALNIPNDTLSEIVKAAGTANISMSVEKADGAAVKEKLPETAKVEGAVAVEFKITSGSKTISSFGGKSLEVSVPVSSKDHTNGKSYVAFIISEDGTVERTVAVIKNGAAVLAMRHFSTVVVTKEEVAAFTDVAAGEYYYDAVLWAVAKGITDGTSDTTFSPGADCTRAQMVTFLWRAAGSPEPSGKTNPFTDVDETAYYFKALLWAVENGITDGTSATTFSPDNTCTRGQMVAFLYRNAKKPPVSGSTSFTDVKSDSYFSSAVVWAANEGITSGTSATTFSPDATCTRGQMVTFLYRYLAD